MPIIRLGEYNGDGYSKKKEFSGAYFWAFPEF
jgi:lysozyme family protein